MELLNLFKFHPSRESIVTRLAVGIVVFLLIYSLIFWGTSVFEGKKWSKYTKTLYELGVILTLLVVVYEVYDQEQRNKADIHDNFVQDTQASFIDIEKRFSDMLPTGIGVQLYQSMNPQNTTLQQPLSLKVDPALDAAFNVQMSNIIFQNIENVLDALKGTTMDWNNPTSSENEWYRTWKTWFQSPLLKQIWEQNKNHYYNPSTVQFIDTNMI